MGEFVIVSLSFPVGLTFASTHESERFWPRGIKRYGVFILLDHGAMKRHTRMTT